MRRQRPAPGPVTPHAVQDSHTVLGDRRYTPEGRCALRLPLTSSAEVGTSTWTAGSTWTRPSPAAGAMYGLLPDSSSLRSDSESRGALTRYAIARIAQRRPGAVRAVEEELRQII
jgi:hypothetical protein